MTNKIKRDRGLIIAITLLAIAILMLFFPYFKLNNITLWDFKIVVPDYDKLGTFISGITSPFLSLSAFVLLYLTYISQKAELVDSKKILEQQNITQQTQRFETTFFNLLNLHHSIVNNIDLNIKEKHTKAWERTHHYETEVKKGRDCFLTFYEGFKTAFKKESNKKLNETILVDDIELIRVNNAYYNFFNKHQYDLGHYFRNLYHLIKFIDKSEIHDKQMYVSLVRAQLSSHELLLIFYNCASNYGQKFTPYMTKYHFLKNMPLELLLDKSHENFFAETAYNS